MADILLPLSPLRPYFGVWRLDPLGRAAQGIAQTARRSGTRRAWKCGSIAELNEMLAADAALAQRYEALPMRVVRRSTCAPPD